MWAKRQPNPFLPPKKKNENNFIRHRSYFHSFFWWQGDVGCLWEIASAFGCPYLIRSNFIKTTYDISLDSWISFLPLGFSPTLKEKTENPKVRKEMESRPAGEARFPSNFGCRLSRTQWFYKQALAPQEVKSLGTDSLNHLKEISVERKRILMAGKILNLEGICSAFVVPGIFMDEQMSSSKVYIFPMAIRFLLFFHCLFSFNFTTRVPRTNPMWN